MFQKFAEFITKKRWYVIAVWIIAAILITAFSPKLADVTSNDQASFLPSSYESAQAQEIASQSFPQSEGQTAIILFKHDDGQPLSQQDQQAIQKVVAKLNAAHIDSVSGVMASPQTLSADKKIQLAVVQLNGDSQDTKLLDAVKELRSMLDTETKDSGLSYAVTGNAAIMLDTQDASSKAESIVGMVTVVLILALPTIVFRSPFAGLLSLLSVSIVFTMTNSLLALTAKTFHFNVSGQLTSLLIVVLFGIGTDYILFLLFRYRERLRSGDHTRGAVSFAMTRAGEAILSAALVVATAFAAMFAASLGFFSSLAPGLIIAVLLMLIAAMTLVPALLSIIGEKIFWPSKRWQQEQTGTVAGRLGKMVAKHPLRVAVVVTIMLVTLASGLTQYKASFDLISQLPSNTESSRGFKDLAAAFPAGTSSPTYVYVKSEQKLNPADLTRLTTVLSQAQGVAAIMPVQLPGDSQPVTPQFVQVSPDGKAAVISLILKDDPNSNEAIEAVSGPIRAAAHSTGLDAQIAVGGETASFADLQAATTRDIKTIVPIAAAAIFVILALLLRSLIAPIYLLLSVGLGVLATLGATSYLFISIGGSTGLIFMLPILLYLFVVAVGTDYNILMITRLREEVHTEGNSPHVAAERAVEHTSTTLISAGVILAGTFASLMLAGMSLLTEMGFSVAFGIALGAFLISLLLIPSVSALLGRWVWWPSHKKVVRRRKK